jgi:hypothetical protein
MNRRIEHPQTNAQERDENDLFSQYKRFLLEKARKEEGFP